MKLLSLTIQRPTAINACAHGSFSAAGAQEIVVARGHVLELLRPDATDATRLNVASSTDCFGVLRSLAPFRLPGGTRDYLVVGSDSGRIVILEFDTSRGAFSRLHAETFGKSGCRRIVPGEFLAADPRGRAVMVAAVEKQKLVYVLNLDVGFENPIFAAIEFDYTDFHADDSECQKVLTFYELDLGLNHVARKWSDAVDNSANIVATVPGWKDGPGGVIICAVNFVYWRNPGKPEVKVAIPRRAGTPNERELMITSVALHKQRGMFFFLLQSEFGDLYKLTLECGDDRVTALNIAYLDTAPVASAMAILRSGYLFLAAEFGDHHFYRFQSTGAAAAAAAVPEEVRGDDEFPHFTPRPLTNLALVDRVASLSPVMDMRILNRALEETAQVYCACGRGARSSLRILRHGLGVTQVAQTPLPRVATAVWTLKTTVRDTIDRYIVVSFPASTIVLAISGDNIAQVSNTNILGTAPTLAVSLLGDDSLVQVHSGGIRIIYRDTRYSDWMPPGHAVISHAACNSQQVVISLAGGDGVLFYFELDSAGQLNEIERREIGREVAALDIAPATAGRRARFMAASDFEGKVRVFSLTPDACLQQAAVQVVPATAQSLCLTETEDSAPAPTAGTVLSASATTATTTTLFLSVGLQNGIMFRSVVDGVTGELSDTRTRFLGSRPAMLCKVRLRDGSAAMVALSSRSWLCYTHQSRFHMTPLCYNPVTFAAPFASEMCPAGFVAIAENTLRIISVDRLGETFSQREVALPRTPRHFLFHPTAECLVLIESDHNAVPDREKRATAVIEAACSSAPAPPASSDQMETDDGPTAAAAAAATTTAQPLDERFFGAVQGGPGKWASAVRLMEPNEGRTLDLIELDENEAAFSVCTAVFPEYDRNEVVVVVGTAKDMTLHPRRCSGGSIHVYRIASGRLELVHRTPTEDVTLALCAFQGRLLAGIGNTLRMYEFGQKKLLRRCEAKNFGNLVVQIHTLGERIYVGDASESFTMARYVVADNRLAAFADDTVPRWLTAGLVLDYDTVASADKFGNLAVTRLPKEISEDVEDDPTGSLLADRGYLNGAPYRTAPLCHFHIGDTATTLQRAVLVPGGSEVLLYATILGAIGALVPFESREDVDFFQHLEMHMRAENPPICGRDHIAFRGAYFPVKDVIDGDLCEQFSSLDPAKQRAIAQELERSPSEVIKKLEDIRHVRLL